MVSAIVLGHRVQVLQRGRHASPVAPPDMMHDCGRRALHHIEMVQEAVGDATQDSVAVVEPWCTRR